MEQCPEKEDGECRVFLFLENSGHCDGNLSKFSSWDHCASNIADVHATPRLSAPEGPLFPT